tara:strand:- start:318 stop:455 length:138 start_codon:yes stop_codon:yes gene_type:complete
MAHLAIPKASETIYIFFPFVIPDAYPFRPDKGVKIVRRRFGEWVK